MTAADQSFGFHGWTDSEIDKISSTERSDNLIHSDIMPLDGLKVNQDLGFLQQSPIITCTCLPYIKENFRLNSMTKTEHLMTPEADDDLERKKMLEQRSKRNLIQKCSEVPTVAHFCSLFCDAFDLLEFDIEELEDSLLTIRTENDTSQLVLRIILKLLKGCGKGSSVAFDKLVHRENYNFYLRQLFLLKNEEADKHGLNKMYKFDCAEFLDNKTDFAELSPRNQVRILKQLTDYRMDAEDAFAKIQRFSIKKLRIEPLGKDSNNVVYWYFYGTRLYKDESDKKHVGLCNISKDTEKKKAAHKMLCRKPPQKSKWSLACSTMPGWTRLANKLKSSSKRCDKELYDELESNYLAGIQKLFDKSKKDDTNISIEIARSSTRVEQKLKEQQYADRWGIIQ